MAFDLPYLIPTVEQWEKLMTGELGEKLKKQVEQQDGLKLLFIMNSGGMRHVNNNRRPLKTPADAKGLKFRASGSPVEQAILRSWGIAPTPITWSETYSAIEQGVVDGLYNGYMWNYVGRVYERVKYVTEVNGNMVLHLCIMNLDKFKSLPPNLQAVLEDAGREGAKLAWKIDERYYQKSKQEFIKKGIQIYTPTPTELEQWKVATKVVWDQFAKTCDPEVMKLIKEEVDKK
jgi:TRAP-type C4-dicarboxylate transport system substrate-binding protein